MAGPGRPGATPKESSTGSFHDGSLKRSASFVAAAAGTPAQQTTLLMYTKSFLLQTKQFHVKTSAIPSDEIAHQHHCDKKVGVPVLSWT